MLSSIFSFIFQIRLPHFPSITSGYFRHLIASSVLKQYRSFNLFGSNCLIQKSVCTIRLLPRCGNNLSNGYNCIDFGFTESKIFKNTCTMYYPSTHNTGITFLSFFAYLFPLYPRTLNPLFHQLFQIRTFSYPLLFPN